MTQSEKLKCKFENLELLDNQEIPILTAETTLMENYKLSNTNNNCLNNNSLMFKSAKNKITINQETGEIIDQTNLSTTQPSPRVYKLPNKANLSSEVWNHFTLEEEGLGVKCHYCSRVMKRTDSSTKSMWGHLKSFHKDDVGEEAFSKKRFRRVLPKRNAQDVQLDASIASIASLLQFEQNSNANESYSQSKKKRYRVKKIEPHLNSNLFNISQIPSTSSSFNFDSSLNSALNILDADHTQNLDDVINRTSNNTTTTSSSPNGIDQDLINLNSNSTFQNFITALMSLNYNGNNDGNDSNELEKNGNLIQTLLNNLNQDLQNEQNLSNLLQVPHNGSNSNSPRVQNGDHSSTSSGSPIIVKRGFSLSDPESLASMHQIAVDLKLTYMMQERKGVLEYAFRSNSAPNKMITLTETNDKVCAAERVNDFIVKSELWEKCNLSQFMWAIRGKCQVLENAE